MLYKYTNLVNFMFFNMAGFSVISYALNGKLKLVSAAMSAPFYPENNTAKGNCRQIKEKSENALLKSIVCSTREGKLTFFPSNLMPTCLSLLTCIRLGLCQILNIQSLH